MTDNARKADWAYRTFLGAVVVWGINWLGGKVDSAQSTSEFVLDATDPVTDGSEWWVVFGIGPLDGPVGRQFEYRQPVA